VLMAPAQPEDEAELVAPAGVDRGAALR
jgi:hypothetical protein